MSGEEPPNPERGPLDRGPSDDAGAPEHSGAPAHVLEKLEQVRQEFRQKKHVQGTGVGPRQVGGIRKNEWAIIVFVDEKVPPEQLDEIDRIPDDIDGVPTDVQGIGTIRAFTANNGRWKRHRPALGGLSVGTSQRNNAGTQTGALVDDTGEEVFLTNKHVVVADAITDDPTGTGVVQPGNYDYDGTPGRIGTVKEVGQMDPTSTTGEGNVDSALVSIDPAEGSQLNIQEVDRFERTTGLGGAWENQGTAAITETAGFRGDRGISVPSSSYVRSYTGLNAYPQAGGGPLGNGAFEVAFRQGATGGSADISRFNFALNAARDTGYRLEFSTNRVGLRKIENGVGTEIMGAPIPDGELNSPGDAVLVRIHEWASNGHFDFEVLDADWVTGDIGQSYYREGATDDRTNPPTSGGIGFWTNASTGAHFDEIVLGTTPNTYDPADYGPATGEDYGNVSSAVVGLAQMDTAGGATANFTTHYVKSGRTTGMTAAHVTAMNTNATVNYDDGANAVTFANVHITEPFAETGDSGAIVAQFIPSTNTYRPIGIIVGGSSQATIVMPWEEIETAHGALATASNTQELVHRTPSQRQNEVVPLATTTDANGEIPLLATNAAGGGTDTASISITRADTGELIKQTSVTVEWAEPTQTTIRLTDVLDPGTHTLGIAIGGGSSAAYEIDVQPSGETEVIGTVTTPAGASIEGADVTVSDDLGTTVFTGTTSGTGRFTTYLDPATYDIAVTASGYVDHTKEVVVEGTTTETTLRLSNKTTQYTQSYSKLTDLNGEAAWGDLRHAAYDIDIRAPEHNTLVDSFDHDETTPQRAYDLVWEDSTRYDVTITVTDLDSTPVEGATVTAIDQSATTDALGEATISLPDGTYTVQAGKSGYDSASTEVTVSGGPASATLAIRYRDEPEENPDEPDVEDPELNLPEYHDFFEVTPAASRASDQFQAPILVSNTGGRAGGAEIHIERDDGTVLDRRYVTLPAAATQVVEMNVRRLAGGPDTVSLTVVGREDSESFELDIPPEPETPVSPGRAMTMGGARGGTMGGQMGGTMGREMERLPVEEPELAQVENGYAITLIGPGGNRRLIEDVIGTSVNPQREHTQLSTWSADVPADNSLEDWVINTRAIITFDGRVVFRGVVNSAPTDETITTLEGVGPGGELKQGSVEFEVAQQIEWRAIENMVEEIAPDWEWHVVRPDDGESVFVRDERFSGNPIECIKQLHDDYGMRFLIDQRDWKRGVSFPAGGITNATEFPDIANVEQKPSAEGYANATEVIGAVGDDGRRVTARYEDSDEVRRLQNDLGVSRAEATIAKQVLDGQVETQEKAEERAKAETREAIQNRELGGSFDIPSRVLNPGVSYPMPWDDDRLNGVYSATPTEGGIELDSDLAGDINESGAITFWCQGPWSQITNTESKFFGAWNSDNEGITVMHGTDNGIRLRVYLEGDTQPRNALIPGDEVIDGVPLFVCVDWEYDSATNQTTLRAGLSSATGEPPAPDGHEPPPDEGGGGTDPGEGDFSEGFGVGGFGIVPFGGEAEDGGGGGEDEFVSGWGLGDWGAGEYGIGDYFDWAEPEPEPGDTGYGATGYGAGYGGSGPESTGYGATDYGANYGSVRNYGEGIYGMGAYGADEPGTTATSLSAFESTSLTGVGPLSVTTVEAQTTGEMTDITLDERTFSGPPVDLESGDIECWLMRFIYDYLDQSAMVGDFRFWSGPQSAADYAWLAEGREIPSTDLIAHFPLDEGPSADGSGTIHDVVGGYHGENRGATFVGDPRTLHSVHYDGRTASLEFARDLDEWGVIENIMEDVDRMKR